MSQRKMAVAGHFYAQNKEELLKHFKIFNNKLEKKESLKNPRAIISPHAGYVYSGFTANVAFSQIKDIKVKRVIVLGPSHRVSYKGASIALFDSYETPLGELNIDLEYSKMLVNRFDFCSFELSAHNEHSTETQMPFIKHYLDEVSVVEIVYGKIDYLTMSELIEYLLKDKDNFLVISTDLSHFYNLEEANIIDSICLKAIKDKKIELFEKGCEACGVIGVKAIISYIIKSNLKVNLLHYCTSYDASGDSSSVVGYVSAIIGE